jgi:hypothetical protein
MFALVQILILNDEVWEGDCDHAVYEPRQTI